jgi:hypothetical protein
MDSQDIFATDGFLTLLDNNLPKKIGRVRNGKYYIPLENRCVECTLVSFEFDQNGNEDLLFFNRDRLVLFILSEDSYKNRNWLAECVGSNQSISKADLVNRVVEIYTAKEMGF